MVLTASRSNSSGQTLSIHVVTFDFPQDSTWRSGRQLARVRTPMVGAWPSHENKFAIKFDGDLFHPNFNESGDIQVDRLIERCSFAFSVTNIFMAIMGLQIAPNPDEPHLDFVGVALIYKKSLESFAKYVRKIMG
ncbi:hypothetical protein V6N12_057312 [Hibiscus sabdariffa]|uniref:UBC core domain-containing protein n=1 Tax=Hibiscus sabdariffa TaxID=183260 RepID=A0ABR2DBK1_9ROSI